MKTAQPFPVTVAISRGPELYHGEPTGKTAYACEVSRSGNPFETFVRLGSVLGRGYTPREAVSDWKRRAMGDGHAIGAVTVATIKPAMQVLAQSAFMPGGACLQWTTAQAQGVDGAPVAG